MTGVYVDQFDLTVRWHDTGGYGAPLVALPGMSFPAFGNFAEVARHPALSERRWIMVDYVGSGDSDRAPAFNGSLADHAACVAAVMDHLALRDCPMLGYSMGGSVGIALAAVRPDLISQLILAEANLTPGGGAASSRIAAMSEQDFANHGRDDLLARLVSKGGADRFTDFVCKSWGAADPVALHRNARALVSLSTEFTARFLALEMPRTFIYGEENFPETGAQPSADAPDPVPLRAAGVTVRSLSGTGHELMLADPTGFAELVSQSLEAQSR